MPEHLIAIAVTLVFVLATAIEVASFVMMPRCPWGTPKGPTIGSTIVLYGCTGVDYRSQERKRVRG